MWVKDIYRGGTPGRPRGGDRPPCAPVDGPPPVAWGRGGTTGPPHPAPPARDLFVNWKKKNYKQVLSPLGWATGVYFRNFSKLTYIFEILIFFRYKKEKFARARAEWAAGLSSGRRNCSISLQRPTCLLTCMQIARPTRRHPAPVRNFESVAKK